MKIKETETREWSLADKVLCTSSFTKKSLIFAGCSSNKISVVPYGIDLKMIDENFNPELTKFKNVKCEFLFVGQGTQRKGLHHLLKVWKKNEFYKFANLTLVLNNIDPGLTNLLNQKGIFLKSNLTRLDLRIQYQNSDIFIMPSLFEGFGLVYLDALSAGLFVIGTHNTGLVDLNLNDESANIIEAANLSMLENSIADGIRRWKNKIDRSGIIKNSKKYTMIDHRKGIQDFLANVKLKNAN